MPRLSYVENGARQPAHNKPTRRGSSQPAVRSSVLLNGFRSQGSGTHPRVPRRQNVRNPLGEMLIVSQMDGQKLSGNDQVRWL